MTGGTWCFGFFLIFMLLCATNCFNLDRFCSIQCKKGKGGHLCNCNGFHFTGKRTPDENVLRNVELLSNSGLDPTLSVDDLRFIDDSTELEAEYWSPEDVARGIRLMSTLFRTPESRR